MKGLDAWTARLHAKMYDDGPPCKNCKCAAEVHDPDTLKCGECDECEDGYEAIDPRDYAPDGWEDADY